MNVLWPLARYHLRRILWFGASRPTTSGDVSGNRSISHGASARYNSGWKDMKRNHANSRCTITKGNVSSVITSSFCCIGVRNMQLGNECCHTCLLQLQRWCNTLKPAKLLVQLILGIQMTAYFCWTLIDDLNYCQKSVLKTDMSSSVQWVRGRCAGTAASDLSRERAGGGAGAA